MRTKLLWIIFRSLRFHRTRSLVGSHPHYHHRLTHKYLFGFNSEFIFLRLSPSRPPSLEDYQPEIIRDRNRQPFCLFFCIQLRVFGSFSDGKHCHWIGKIIRSHLFQLTFYGSYVPRLTVSISGVPFHHSPFSNALIRKKWRARWPLWTDSCDLLNVNRY